MPFQVKKGAADPFRGDWYIHEKTCETLADAIAVAIKLTHQNYLELGHSWEQCGYEWSVFELAAADEKKIWEGYKAMMTVRDKKITIPVAEDGFLS